MNRHQAQEEILNWEMIFDILSLDYTGLFLSKMGLYLSDTKAVQVSARWFVEQCRLLSNDESAKRLLIEKTLANIAQEAGEFEFQSIYQWGSKIFPLGKKEGFFYWITLLTWLSKIANKHLSITYPSLSPDKIQSIIEIINKNFNDLDMLDEQIQEAKRSPQSDWDRTFCNSFTEDYSPLLTVSNIIHDYRFLQAWSEIKILLTGEELGTLLLWAKEQASSLYIDPELINLPVT